MLQLFCEQPQTATFFAKPIPAHKCFAPALLTTGVDGAEAYLFVLKPTKEVKTLTSDSEDCFPCQLKCICMMWRQAPCWCRLILQEHTVSRACRDSRSCQEIDMPLCKPDFVDCHQCLKSTHIKPERYIGALLLGFLHLSASNPGMWLFSQPWILLLSCPIRRGWSSLSKFLLHLLGCFWLPSELQLHSYLSHHYYNWKSHHLQCALQIMWWCGRGELKGTDGEIQFWFKGKI